MPTLTTIGIIFTLFVGTGVLVDKLLLKQQKNRLHHVMYNWWFRLEKTKARNLGKLMAEYSLKVIGKISFRFWSWQTWIFLIIISWVLTSIASIIGYYLTPGVQKTSPIPLPHFTVYIANFPFDLLTVYVTFHVLKIIRTATPLISLAAIAIDIIIASIFVIICFVFVWWGADKALNYSWWGQDYTQKYLGQEFIKNNKDNLIKDGFSKNVTIHYYRKLSLQDYLKISLNSYKSVSKGGFYRYPVTVIYEASEGDKKINYQRKENTVFSWFSLLLPLTSFLPTLFYMFFLVVLILGKIIIESIMHLLNVMTEPDPEKDPKDFIPGTLIGLLFGIIAAFVKAIVEVIKVYSIST